MNQETKIHYQKLIKIAKQIFQIIIIQNQTILVIKI